MAFLRANEGEAFTAEQVAKELGLESHTEFIFKLLENMAANPTKFVEKQFGNAINQHRSLYSN